jgi:two-component system sensor histidine kinase HydH
MRMKQVVINLVINAVQASPEGETVIVRSHYKGQNLAIDIVDQGSGIPSEKREEIFYPFVSTKKEGTGLGLAIVRKIIEAHNGQVRILDNPKRGVTFRVLIPWS